MQILAGRIHFVEGAYSFDMCVRSVTTSTVLRGLARV